MNSSSRARLGLISAMTVFGTIGLFVRAIPLSSGEIALYRALAALLLLAGYMLITKKKISFKDAKKESLLLFVSGAAMGFNWILLFEAYKYTSVSVATLAYYFAPVIVTVVCPILFKEKMGAKQWICFGMSTIGIFLLTGIGGFSSDTRNLIGILFGLGAALLYASVVLLNKYIKRTENVQRTFLQFVAAAAVLLPYVFLTGGTKIFTLDAKGWIALATVGIVHTGISYCIYFSSIKNLSGQQTAILSYIDPLVAVLLSVFILKEKITPWQIIGGALILGFTLWNELSSRKKEQK